MLLLKSRESDEKRGIHMNPCQRTEPVPLYQVVTCLLWETLKAVLWGIIILITRAIMPLAPDLGYRLVRFWLKVTNKLDKKMVQLYY
ncbi:MAG: hypothetical protein VR69_09230 [Peptococcaceae bacterium BRH_c4b]|nr:MAG: hypothetical protein VR69_09230 [Peptococcaceae bacterium BRH_c4b]